MKNWIDSDRNPKDIIISSKVILTRNFEKYLFTDKMEEDEARMNVDKIYSMLSNAFPKEDLELIKLWEYDYKKIKAYFERYLISNELLKRNDRGAFILNRDETISIMINEEDHIRIQCISDGLDLQSELCQANIFDDLLEKIAPYAFHEDYGYLTSKPCNIGTGLKAKVKVHLPALTMCDGICNISNGLNQVGMTINSVYGEENKATGNIYEISNKITTGISEEEIINSLSGVIENIVNEENNFRKKLINDSKEEIEDSIYRAYGILKNARLLSSKEVLEYLSNIRFGIELGLIDIDKKIINTLMINTRDTVMQDNVNMNLSTRDKNINRAKIIRENLK